MGFQNQREKTTGKLFNKTCELVSVDIKKSKIEIAHRIKNGDIIVKFKGRISRDLVYNNKLKLKVKMTKDLGFNKESSIFINESLSFDNKKLLYDI